MALAYMAQNNSLTSAKDIVEELGMPRRLLTEVLKELSRQKVVTGITGPKGGYRLERCASKITLCEIVEALEGPLSFVDCAEGGECDRSPSCLIQSGVKKIATDIRHLLTNVTLAEVALGDSAHQSLIDTIAV